MNELQIFNNPEFGEIRAIEIDGEPWFVGKDVAAALGYKDTVNALKAHVDEEDKGGWRIATPSGEQQMVTINESGVYSLIFSSKLPKAKTFKRWVTSEVLPSIRKTGAYLSPELAESLADLPAMMELIGEMEDRISALERRGTTLPAQLEAAPEGMAGSFAPGLAARKRWMRTVSEKLDLMSARFRQTHNEILHSLYKHLEKKHSLSLEEEKLRAIEEQDLDSCSVLAAIFYNPMLRADFQVNIDYNLAPENRGW